MRVDLHVHTSEYSACAISSEKEQIETAIARGLDGIALTEHGIQRKQADLDRLNRKYAPFKIFTGVEVNVVGSYEDILVIGVPDMTEYNGGRREYKSIWEYQDLYKFVHERGGFIAVPHPFRHGDKVKTDVVSFVPDALELKSKNIDPGNAKLIKALARELGIKTIVASDSHHVKNTGTHHLVLHNAVHTDEDLVRELKSGQYEHGEIR